LELVVGVEESDMETACCSERSSFEPKELQRFDETKELPDS